MSLDAGARLGPYEVLGLIGVGGMAEVYKARDTRLDRTVAIKVLRPHLSDPEHRARFEREARMIAGLSHPHICSLYDVGEHDSASFLVMEHLVGETLAERLRKGALPIDYALEAGVQVADALSAAHRAGIIHRDLKPGNIMLTKSGVKLLDFGLAKLNAPAPEPAFLSDTVPPTQSEPLTGRGALLGTLHYMAPEQLEGREPDARTDIWALGLVLYEMMTGQRAFEATAAVSLIAAILEHEPTPLAIVQPMTPPALDRIVRQCLAKSADDRPDTAHDVANELRRIREASRSTTEGTAFGKRWRSIAPALVTSAALVFVLTGAGVVWFLRPPPPKASHDIARGVIPITSLAGYEEDPVLSPDGTRVAFLWRKRPTSDLSHLYVQLVNRGEPLQLTQVEGEYLYPAWNHDGTEVAVLRRTREGHDVIAVPSLGGSERLLVRSMAPPLGLDYSSDGQSLAYIDRRIETEEPAIFLLSLATSQKRRLTTPEPLLQQKTLDVLPRFSPKGHRIAFQRVIDGTGGEGPILTMDLADGATTTAVPQEFFADFDWTEDERRMVVSVGGMRSSWLAEIPLADSARWAGREPSHEDPLERFRLPYGNGAKSVSIANGRLVFAQYLHDANIWRLPGPTAPHGTADQMLIGSTRQDIAYDYSPDGSTIVFISDRATEFEAIWVCDADGANPRQLTHLGKTARWPQFSPDGRLLFNLLDDGAVYVADLRGGPIERLTTDGFTHWMPSWSRDGRSLLFDSNRRSNVRQIWKMDLDGRTMTELTRSPGAKFRPVESGGYVYYYQPVTTSSYSSVRTAIRAHGISRVPSTGGNEEQIASRVPYRYWTIFNGSLVYVRYTESGDAVIEMMNLTTRAVTLLRRLNPDTELSDLSVPYMPVSPDGRWLLLTKNDRSGSDVMLLENFR